MNRETTEQEKQVFTFLNILRESGVVNMFRAIPYITKEFSNINKKQASGLLSLWMRNYNPQGEYHSIEDPNHSINPNNDN